MKKILATVLIISLINQAVYSQTISDSADKYEIAPQSAFMNRPPAFAKLSGKDRRNMLGHLDHSPLSSFNRNLVLETLGVTDSAERQKSDGVDEEESEDNKYVYDKDWKRAELKELRYKMGIIDPNDGEYVTLYTEVKEIFQNLLQAAGNMQADIFLADLNDPNAGAYIYLNFIVVNIGLFKILQEHGVLSKDIIAFVLAHEIMHLMQYREDVDRGLIKGLPDYLWSQPFYKRKFHEKQESYAREYDADTRALKLVNDANYNLMKVEDFFKLIAEDHKDKSLFQALRDILSNHPDPKDRVENLKAIRETANWRETKRTQYFSNTAVSEITGVRSAFRRRQEELINIKTLDNLEQEIERCMNIEELQMLLTYNLETIVDKELCEDDVDTNNCPPGYEDLMNHLPRMAGAIRAKLTASTKDPNTTFGYRNNCRYTDYSIGVTWHGQNVNKYFPTKSPEEFLGWLLMNDILTGYYFDDKSSMFHEELEQLRSIRLPQKMLDLKMRVAYIKEKIKDKAKQLSVDKDLNTQSKLVLFHLGIDAGHSCYAERPGRPKNEEVYSSRIDQFLEGKTLNELIEILRDFQGIETWGFDIDIKDKEEKWVFCMSRSSVNSFNSDSLSFFLKRIALKLLTMLDSNSIEDCLKLCEMLSKTPQILLRPWHEPYGKEVLDSLADKLLGKAEESQEAHGKILSCFLNNSFFYGGHGYDPDNKVIKFIYNELLRNDNNEQIWNVYDRQRDLAIGICDLFFKAIKEGRDENILFYEDYIIGVITKILKRLKLLDLSILAERAKTDEKVFGHDIEYGDLLTYLLNDILKRCRGDAERQAEIFKNIIASLEHYNKELGEQKLLQCTRIYQIYWSFVESLDDSFLNSKVKEIIDEFNSASGTEDYRIQWPDTPVNRNILALIFYFYHGGILDTRDFREKTRLVLEGCSMQEMALAVRFLNHPQMLFMQKDRGILERFDLKKVHKDNLKDLKEAARMAHYEKNFVSPEQITTDHALYKTATWGEYILFFNLAYTLKRNNREEELQKLLDYDNNPEAFRMYLGEVYVGNLVEEAEDFPDSIFAEHGKREKILTAKIRKRFMIWKQLVAFLEPLVFKILLRVPKYLDRRDFVSDVRNSFRMEHLLPAGMTFEDKLEYICKLFPPTVFRNYLLLTALFQKVVEIDDTFCIGVYTDINALAMLIRKREGQGKDNGDIYTAIQKIAPHLIEDPRLDCINKGLFSYFGLKQKRLKRGGLGSKSASRDEEKIGWRSAFYKIIEYYRLERLYKRVKKNPDSEDLQNRYKEKARSFIWGRFDDSYEFFKRNKEMFDLEFLHVLTKNEIIETVFGMLFSDNLFINLIRRAYLAYLEYINKAPKVDLFYFDYNRKDTQLDTRIGNLAASYISGIINFNQPFTPKLQSPVLQNGVSGFIKKVETINTFFRRPSPVKDYYLEMLAGYDFKKYRENELNLEDLLQQLLVLRGLYYNSYLKDQLGIRILEIEEEVSPQDYDSIQKKVDKVCYYFENGYTRDDLLLTLVDEARTYTEYAYIHKKLYQFKGSILEKDAAKKVYYEDHIKSLLARAGVEEKKEFLLWIMGVIPKPLYMREWEVYLGISLDRLKEIYKAKTIGKYRYAGQSMRRQLVRNLFLGKNGILSDTNEFNDFLDKIFKMTAPKGNVSQKTLRNIFNTVMEYSSSYRKLDILQALSINLADALEGKGCSESEVIKGFFESMGLIGIKIAQVLAHSSDIEIPDNVRIALRELSSQADPLSKMVAFESVEHLYQGEFSDNFEYIGEQLGSASIKVVFRARKKGAGKDIVLKIKRPKVDQLLEEDLQFLRDVLGSLRKKGLAVSDGLEEQVSGALADDVDFDLEEELAGNFRNQLAKMNPQYRLEDGTPVEISIASIQKVLNGKIMETDLVAGDSMEGFAGSKGEGVVQQIRRIIFDYLMEQMFTYGFYNADPHTGNFRIVSEDGRLKIVFIDTGSAEYVRLCKEELDALLESLLWLKLNPNRPVPKRFLYTSIFFKKIGYLMKDMTAVEILEVIFRKMEKRKGHQAPHVSPEVYIKKFKAKFLSEKSVRRIGKKWIVAKLLIRAREHLRQDNLRLARQEVEQILSIDQRHTEALGLLEKINYMEIARQLSMETAELVGLFINLDQQDSETLRKRFLNAIKPDNNDIPEDILKNSMDILAKNIELARNVVVRYPDFIKRKFRREIIKRIALSKTIKEIQPEIDRRKEQKGIGARDAVRLGEEYNLSAAIRVSA